MPHKRNQSSAKSMSQLFCNTENVEYNARTNNFHVFYPYFLLSISLHHQFVQQGNERRLRSLDEPFMSSCCHCVQSYRFLGEKNCEPLVVSDVLNLSDHDLTRLLKKSFVIKCGVQCVENFGNAVMFTYPHSVHRCQSCEWNDRNIK